MANAYLYLASIMNDLSSRPAAVVAGAVLLLASALALACTWALGIDAVESNGARVFFMVLWGYLAWAAYGGGGWVRVAILAVFGVSAWSAWNAPSFAGALAEMPAGEVVAKGLALAALAALWTPAAHRWFASARQWRAAAGS